MVDRRYGKRPFSSNEWEEKEDINFPIYSARSQHDMSAMVSVLSQVISNTNNTTNISSSSSMHEIDPLTLPQPTTNQIHEQGTYLDRTQTCIFFLINKIY